MRTTFRSPWPAAAALTWPLGAAVPFSSDGILVGMGAASPVVLPVVAQAVVSLLLVPVMAGMGVGAGLLVLWFVLGRKRKDETFMPVTLPGMRTVPARQRAVAPATPSEVRAVEKPAGCVVIIHEPGVRSGARDAIRRHDLTPKPKTVGASPFCDISLADPDRSLGGEMARVWVQNGSIMCHYISSLSAMATEGSQGGWAIFENGDSMEFGDYRLIFETEVVQAKPAPAPPAEPTERELRPLGQFWPLTIGDPDTN